MLAHPTLEKLHAMQLFGMAKALDEQRTLREVADIPFEDRLGLLVDREMVERENRYLKLRLQKARLRPTAPPPRLLEGLGVGRGDGRYAKLLDAFARLDLLVLDDWGIAPLADEQRRDLLEIIEDRHGRKSILVVSQIPVEKWHGAIGNPTIADPIPDRLVHTAYRIP